VICGVPSNACDPLLMAIRAKVNKPLNRGGPLKEKTLHGKGFRVKGKQNFARTHSVVAAGSPNVDSRKDKCKDFKRTTSHNRLDAQQPCRHMDERPEHGHPSWI
jgi:hypothetical protein